MAQQAAAKKRCKTKLDHVDDVHVVEPDVLSAGACDKLIRWAAERVPLQPRSALQPTFVLVPESDWGRAITVVQTLLQHINSEWWRLPRDAWHVTISSYTPGNYFPEHCDHSPDYPDYAPGITFAASVLLSEPEAFTGGTVHIDGEAVPKIRGTAACFHAFAPHSVDVIEDGERLALNVFATLGTLGETLQRGWPAEWLYAADDPAV